MTGVFTGIAWAVGVLLTIAAFISLVYGLIMVADQQEPTKIGLRLLAAAVTSAILAGACFGWLFGGGA